jgi:hypothetical protein
LGWVSADIWKAWWRGEFSGDEFTYSPEECRECGWMRADCTCPENGE